MLLSLKAIHVNRGPFATSRIRSNPKRLVSRWYNPRVDIKIAYGITGDFEWVKPGGARLEYFYATKAESYILVVPGKKTMEEAIKERALKTGGAPTWTRVPNSGMIEYLHSDKPNSRNMEVVVVVMEWSQEPNNSP